MDIEQNYREEIVRYGRYLYQKDFVAATDGNLSVRLESGNILCTPSGVNKGMMEPADLVVVDSRGGKITGSNRPSTEMAMHLLIYRLRPEVRSVVHAHPTTATAYAAAGIALDQPLISELMLSVGPIPLASYATPGTPELAASLEPLIPNHNAILMANHGVVSYGPSLQDAYMNMERVEHFAKVALVTHLLGRQRPLSAAESEKLLAIRIGERS